MIRKRPVGALPERFGSAIRTRPARALASLLLLAMAPPAAFAVDGRLEINQAKALAGGVTPGDAPGFPVEIHVPGSYVLTSTLVPGSADVNGIELRADDIWLDLNGFGVQGPLVCDFSGSGCSGGGSGTGIVVPAGAQSVRSTVRNGFVRGMPAGVLVRDDSHVDGLRVADIAGPAITATGHSLVTNCQVAGAEQQGILGAPGELVRIRGNAVRSAEDGSYEFTRAIGANECADGRCSPLGARRFYLTDGTFDGGQALNACAEGYHMASLWEIYDVSNLVYDTVRGYDDGDVGSGPPTGLFGWVRTGAALGPIGSIGNANCNGYAPGTTTGSGTFVRLPDSWTTSSAGDIDPWAAGAGVCSAPRRVWCAED